MRGEILGFERRRAERREKLGNCHVGGHGWCDGQQVAAAHEIQRRANRSMRGGMKSEEQKELWSA